MQFEGVIQHPGLFQVEFGLFGIVLSLGQFRGIIRVDPGNGVIVARVTVPTQYQLHQLLTVNKVFESQPDIVIVIGLDGRQHRNGVVPGSF